MIQRDKLIEFGISEDSLESYENNFARNLSPVFFGQARSYFLKLSPGSDGYYSYVNLTSYQGYMLIDSRAYMKIDNNNLFTISTQDNIMYCVHSIRNAQYSYIESGGVDITGTIYPEITTATAFSNVLYSHFGNGIIIDNDGTDKVMTVLATLKHPDYISHEVLRDFYLLIGSMYMQDYEVIYDAINKFNITLKNCIAENKQIKPVTRRKVLELTPWTM